MLASVKDNLSLCASCCDARGHPGHHLQSILALKKFTESNQDSRLNTKLLRDMLNTNTRTQTAQFIIQVQQSWFLPQIRDIEGRGQENCHRIKRLKQHNNSKQCVHPIWSLT